MTILFIIMAIVQLKNARRLQTFKLDGPGAGKNKNSFHSDEEIKAAEMPWLFWKWIIPLYISVVVNQLALFFDFCVAELSNDPFLIFAGSDDKSLWLLLPSVPTILILFEWPFN